MIPRLRCLTPIPVFPSPSLSEALPFSHNFKLYILLPYVICWSQKKSKKKKKKKIDFEFLNAVKM